MFFCVLLYAFEREMHNKNGCIATVILVILVAVILVAELSVNTQIGKLISNIKYFWLVKVIIYYKSLKSVNLKSQVKERMVINMWNNEGTKPYFGWSRRYEGQTVWPQTSCETEIQRALCPLRTSRYSPTATTEADREESEVIKFRINILTLVVWLWLMH